LARGAPAFGRGSRPRPAESGDLYLPESRHHVSFWNLVHGPEAWAETRERAYAALALPTEPSDALERVRKDLLKRCRVLVG
jgi:hypothetical protein